jgi:hypothetical protein
VQIEDDVVVRDVPAAASARREILPPYSPAAEPVVTKAEPVAAARSANSEAVAQSEPAEIGSAPSIQPADKEQPKIETLTFAERMALFG